jgi:thiol-disulfide isomerase/thioredoxin
MVETTSSLSNSASSTISSLSSAISANSKNIVIVLVIVAAIGGILYYVIKNDMIPGLNKFFQESQGVTPAPDGIGATDKLAQLFLFKVDWCPHCKSAKPIFDEIEKEQKGKPINGYTVTFTTVDCEAEPDMADKFKIEGYPTIKLVKDGQVIEYDAKPEKDKINEFLNTVI